jgi:DNA polymerase III subunit alpha
LIPVAKSKDSDLLLTQFDNSVVESAGMLKMDFLGLKTLSIIKTAVENVYKRHGIKIDIDNLPLDDANTYALFQRGETVGTFQFESPGMQKHLRALKPDRFEDLIAMNALYRPGPMEYIPNYIARKHGREPIVYDLPAMEEYLAETYGITVYQEQVMLLSQKLAGFTKGEADVLRKAMGKKQKDVLDKMKSTFVEKAVANGHPAVKVEKIWKDWEAFAAYAFNKSHSTCYAALAYQTGYLKANYPAEFMASILTHNLSSADKVSEFMEECRNSKIPVLGPHVNESGLDFMVNKKGEIRFGLGAIKGTGESAVQAIIEEREAKGSFADIFDFAARVNLRAVNKKSFESLAKAGAFDCFPEFHRRQYIDPDAEGTNVSEKAVRYANRMQEEASSSQGSLFGTTTAATISKPRVQNIEPYGEIEKLNIEREMVGLYISGHPLDQYKFELQHLVKGKLGDLKEARLDQSIRVAGIVSNVQHRVSKKGNPFGQFTLEDFTDNYTFYLFGQDYLKFKPMLEPGWFLYIAGHMAPRYGSGELEFKINSIDHLSELRDKMTKGLEITLKLEDVNPLVVDELDRISQKFPGKSSIKMNFVSVHEERAVRLEMLSRKYSVKVTDELMKELEAFEELDVRVLTV